MAIYYFMLYIVEMLYRGKTMKYLLITLLLIASSVFADEKHSEPSSTVIETTTLTLPAQTTYGLLALAASGNQLDWGVPDKLQLSIAGAFTEGGNQAISFAVGTRFGGVLVNASFVTTIDAPDSQDDYAVVVGGTIRF